MFLAILPIFLLMGVGAGARGLKWINDPAEQALLKLVINLIYPAFLFWLISQNEALRGDGVIVSAVIIGFVFVLIGYGAYYLCAPAFGLKKGPERRTFSFTGGVYNYGYFAIPVCTPIFGLETTGVLMVISVGVELAMWSVGVLIVSGEINRRSIRRIFSPPIIAILCAIPVNLLEFTPMIPSVLMDFLGVLGDCAIPLGLIMIGATIQGLIVAAPIFTRPAIAVGSCCARLLLLPVIFIAAIYVLPLPLVIEKAALVHAAMPCGVFPIVLARIYNGALDIALRTVIPTLFVSLLTIPIWMKLGIQWMGW